MKVYLVADLGTSALRAAAIDAEGATLAAHSVPLSIAAPAPGAAEADPETWWAALRDAFAHILKTAPKPDAICLTGMTRGQIFLEANGAILRPAILWADTRAAPLDIAIDNPAVAINPFHALARIAWVARNAPDIFARVARVIEPKDWLNYRLTGTIGADSVTAARFDAVPADAPHRGLIDLARIEPWAKIGIVNSIPELEGVPVFAGAMDTWAGAVGTGVVSPGQAYDVAGTTEQAGVLTATRVKAHGLVDLPWTPDAFQAGGPTQAGGDALAWARDLVAKELDFDAALALAATADPANAPIFVPYLAGERAPVWRADVRGTLIGLAREHRPADILYAAVEGVALALADIIAASGAAPSALRISGGGARSDFWCQTKADVLGIAVERPREIEAGLLGAAACAAFGLGHTPDFATAAARMNPVSRIFRPDPAKAPLYAARRARYAGAKNYILGSG